MANAVHPGARAWGNAWWGRAQRFRSWWHARLERASEPLDLHLNDSPPLPQTPHLAPAIGEDPAFARLFTDFEQPLYGYVRRMVANDEIAIDVTQETFFRAWQHFTTLRTYTRPQAWLYRVATHLALNLRRERTIPFSRFFERRQSDDDETLPGMQIADALDLEAQTVARDVIARALAALPERDRAMLLLRAVHDLTFNEIGAALDLSESATRKALSRARERFRNALLAMEADA